MTQLYVGNLSAEGDEKAVRLLFGKYGPVREVLMKNGYAFVEFESPLSAEESMRELNGSDILGHPMIVEPSHQQRLSSRRKIQHGKVEVTDIPHHFTIPNVEAYMSQIGQVLKMEIEETEYGVKKIIVTYETQEQAQKAASILGEGNDQLPRVGYIEMGMNGIRTITTRKSSPGIPAQPNKNNTDFPLRILVPSDMVGAIIGKDGATIRMITQITKARVDVHRRENLGTAEKAITTIGPPECCTEACYQIMKIMQSELLMTNGIIESGKFHEPLPVVPLKILAHNELVGRVIGKGGGTLKRIMAESGTKITISKLKDLTAFNMERTITILGTIDNCKKAESLISAKLRASYESDMAQFIPESGYGSTTLSPSPTNVPSQSSQGSMGLSGGDFNSRIPHAGVQSLPATPSSTSVRTFTDYSGEHTRLTTLHASAGALEVNNLGGFKLGPTALANGNKFANALESSIDGIVRTNTSIAPNNDFGSSLNSHIRTSSNNPVEHLGLGQNLISKQNSVMSSNILTMSSGVNVMGNGIGNGPSMSQFHSGFMQGHNQAVDAGLNEVDDMSDVFTGLSFKEPSIVAAPGYGRSCLRRSSAPVNGDQGNFGTSGTGYGLWGGSEHPLPGVSEVEYRIPTSRNSPIQHLNHTNGSFSAGISPHPSFNTAWSNSQSSGGGGGNGTQSIWSQSSFHHNTGIGSSSSGPGINGSNSRPNSQTSSYSSSDSSLSGISPIYSPTTSNGFGGFAANGIPTSENVGLLTTAPLGMGAGEERESRSPFRVHASVPTPLTTVAETITTNGNRVEEDDFYPSSSFVNDLLGEGSQPSMVPPISVGFQW